MLELEYKFKKLDKNNCTKDQLKLQFLLSKITGWLEYIGVFSQLGADNVLVK
jgi:hypothetical protein